MPAIDTPPPRQRILLPDPPKAANSLPGPHHLKQLSAALHPPWAPGECARLLTRTPKAGKQTLVVTVDRPVVLGRSSRADYQLASPLASSFHARLAATVSDTGHTLVTLSDGSSNGTVVNGRRVSHRSLVLCDGDRFE